MRTLDIVGQNFELGHALDLSVPGKKQALVGLFGVGLLGVLTNDDPPGEDALALPVENTLVELATVAVGLGVLDDQVIVDVLIAVHQIQPVKRTLAALTI